MRYLFFFLACLNQAFAQNIHIRVNLIGYFPEDAKVALILSEEPIEGKIGLVEALSGESVVSGSPEPAKGAKWGRFQHQYWFDFTSCKKEGVYFIEVEGVKSVGFTISPQAYGNYQEDLLAFMRQQRCGYNPYFDEVCHRWDGRVFFAPAADSTYYDFSGGWHDAGDQLKYLITSSNATARMLLAYELAPKRFIDQVDGYGHPYPNGIPDVLDEARWGLEWILKLHPKEGWLIHQIADDRDHRGFKFPHQDNANYGWGPNSYRAAYFATGKPQGLGKWKSEATGIANLAGRSAAALAMGARAWAPIDEPFARRCRKAAEELYLMGREQEGYQQGNSYGAPYRYNEDTWADDMEWGAAELYKLTGKEAYLQDALRYAEMIREEGWMARDTMMHYQKYPFMNVGHFALYAAAPEDMQAQLAGWYRANIEKVLNRAETNAFRIGVPFLWCSNNLLVNFITQVELYERMTGDTRYRAAMILHRDWLFGRNPWGTSMFTGIPALGETPVDVHLPPRALLQETPPGGLIDGPIFRTIHDYLKGLTLNEPDEFADFQNDFIVYHDDIGDYSTNEPTMDGTADAILIMALWSKGY
ncbi:MAG: glycoside hydrolase family 9 protein [Phaeodactylibacter sp.]|nr:glycoside hydrolase family 9 protein [Phaeodactylibacter sp.]MCB9048546.1 glycoside hydrolase family 9 protein [Lewinellaceae bacterium]